MILRSPCSDVVAPELSLPGLPFDGLIPSRARGPRSSTRQHAAELEVLLLTPAAIAEAAVVGLEDAESGEPQKASVVRADSHLDLAADESRRS